MVLTSIKKAVFVFSLVIFNVILAFSDVRASGLIQYGENIDRNRLELLEVQQEIRLPDGRGYFITGTYTIRNSGEKYAATLGVLFDAWSAPPPSLSDLEIQFFVDGTPIDHSVRLNERGTVTMGETTIQLPISSTSWALIEVVFPQNSIITITVQYINSLIFSVFEQNVFLDYNPAFLSYFPNLLHWGETPKFSVIVVNEFRSDFFIQNSTVEADWITDIVFERIIGAATPAARFLRTSSYLRTLQDLYSPLMYIQRLSGNTFRIDFTEDFLAQYTRSFRIIFEGWLGNWRFWRADDAPDRHDVILDFWNPHALDTYGNISRRILSPYELIFFTRNQLWVVRNMFFAQHGFIFQSEELTIMFNRLGNFYQPNPNFHEGMLTDIDRANIAIIQRLEALVGD